jgi:sn-glycerol 3-phosphate transport system ATP-binding protein
MGRCIVREPKAFLFDEPLSNLDAKLRVAMRLELKQLQRRLATTGVYVTHDQVEAMTLGDRLVVLNAGRIEQIGAPLEVYRRPASRFVAGFIGSPAMNFVEAALAADGTAVQLDGVRLPLAGRRPPADGGEVLVGIRPEHLRRAVAEPSFSLSVEGVEALGADTLAHGRLASGAALSVRLEGKELPQPGDRLDLTVEPGDLHVFSMVDGRRLSD